jgi:hypothetical protein
LNAFSCCSRSKMGRARPGSLMGPGIAPKRTPAYEMYGSGRPKKPPLGGRSCNGIGLSQRATCLTFHSRFQNLRIICCPHDATPCLVVLSIDRASESRIRSKYRDLCKTQTVWTWAEKGRQQSESPPKRALVVVTMESACSRSRRQHLSFDLGNFVPVARRQCLQRRRRWQWPARPIHIEKIAWKEKGPASVQGQSGAFR